jgi:cobalamin biosynthesis protein CobD/CbiB
MPFLKGGPGGPGRPPKAAEDRLLDLVKSAVTPSELRAVMRTLAQKAKDGDVPAARLLLSYLIGLPTDTSTAERLSALENLAHELSNARQN